MKKPVILSAIALAALGVWLTAQNAAVPKPLAEVVPGGAMLYLEAKSFTGLLADWNASPEKRSWLASGNYQVFSRSRLYLRLRQVFDEYADATGVPPDFNLLNSIAGGESALAVYDISNLEFLYLTRLPSAKAMESLLWKAKAGFTARTAAGVPYYSKSAAGGKRTAAFAIAGDMLLLSTREEALTGALGLLSGAAGATVRREPWFDTAIRSTGNPGELRMVLNMEKLARASSFRSYWVQRNVSDLRQYSAGVNDLTRSAAEVSEERVLLRQEPVTAPDASAVGGVLRLARNAGLYRAWAQPEPAFVLNLVTSKILRPGPTTAAESQSAPSVSLDAAQAGDEEDLETRIDGVPFQPPGFVYKPERLEALLQANRPQALLHMQSSRLTPDRIFVTNDSALAVQSPMDWNLNNVRDAVQQAVEGLYTTAKIGAGWRERRVGTEVLWEMDGLARVSLAVRGKLLLLSSQPEYLESLLPLLQSAPVATATYSAGYRTAAELSNYTRIMRLIEAPQGAYGGQGAEPPLFSVNLSSLARALQRVQSASIVANDDGRLVKQSIRYRFTR